MWHFQHISPRDSVLPKDPVVSSTALAVIFAPRNDTWRSSISVEISAEFDKPLEPHSVMHILWRLGRMVKNEYLSFWARGEHTNKKYVKRYSPKLRVRKRLVKLLPRNLIESSWIQYSKFNHIYDFENLIEQFPGQLEFFTANASW